MAIHISGIFYYPIKSCAGTTVTKAPFDCQGLVHDRRWMLVDEDGVFLTQREHATMAMIRPTVHDDCLVVSAPGVTNLVVPRDRAHRQTHPATVWKFTGVAEDEGDAAADWFSDVLKTRCRLVRTGISWDRPINPNYARPDDRVSFADGYPLLLATEASLADLNTHLKSPLPMDRFRPNLVVRGDLPAWAEDNWKTLHIPSTDARFRVAKPCARCSMTTIDQQTAAATGPEPLTTLSRLRRSDDGKVLFGTNLIPEGSGVLRVGDLVEVSDSHAD